MIKKLYNKIKNNLNDAQFITVDYIRKCKFQMLEIQRHFLKKYIL